MQSFLFILFIFFTDDPQKKRDISVYNDWVKIGEASYSNADFHNAVFYFSRAIKENRQAVEAYLLRGKTYVMLDKYHLAMDDYQMAMKIDPDFVKQYLKRQKNINKRIGEMKQIKNIDHLN